MLEDLSARARTEALAQFQQAQNKAQRESLSARLTGKETKLLPFEEIRKELRQQNPRYQGVQEIPLDLIIGSVGRYKDLTRTFLPVNDSLRERWIKVTAEAIEAGWPPIELYKVGNAYFVRDGNHRVSAARQLEYPTIEAHVWEYSNEIEIDPEETLDSVLIRLGERNFLELTQLDTRQPDHNIRFTTPGRYSEMLAQIEELRRKLSQIDGQEMSFETAVDAWYEMIYLPTIQIIRESALLQEFPGRTEADLFVWMSTMRDPLQQQFGEFDNLADLAHYLTENYKPGPVNKVTRQVQRLLGQDPLPPLDETIF